MRVLGLGFLVSSIVTATVSPTLAQEPPSPPKPAAPAQIAPAPSRAPAPPLPAASKLPAQPPAGASSAPGPAVVLVMESSGGLRAAAELRLALSQVGHRVLSPAEARHKGQQPDAVLTVAFTPPSATSGARSVYATYWGRDGRTDSLSAASLATLDQMNAVALALSSALIDRHKSDVIEPGADFSPRVRLFQDVRAPGVLYAMVTNAPRTNVRLRFEDF